MSARRPWTIVIVREGTTSSSSCELPAGFFASMCALGTLALFAIGALGFHLQPYFGWRGHAVQFAREGAAAQRRWTGFERLPSSVQGEEAAALRRKGAIVYAMKLGLGTRRAASQLLTGVVEPQWRSAAGRGPQGNGTLRWPVAEGWYVRGYGSGEAGYHLAVDIMGERGSDVLASAPGIVGYSGNTVRGFGNMVMVVHAGGFVTLYAHNQKNLVVPGERVVTGQVLAELGNTGISRGPHVHFEFIHGGRNCDPLPLFRPGVRHRAGHLGDVATASWLADAARPGAVRCAPRRAHPHSRWMHTDGDMMEEEPREPSAAAEPSDGDAPAPAAAPAAAPAPTPSASEPSGAQQVGEIDVGPIEPRPSMLGRALAERPPQ